MTSNGSESFNFVKGMGYGILFGGDMLFWEQLGLCLYLAWVGFVEFGIGV
jgi:hypothetical protein